MRRAILLALLASPALADPAADAATLDACVEAAPTVQAARADCVEALAIPCTALPENQEPEGLAVCFRREVAAWEALMQADLARLAAPLDGAQRTALDTSQVDWATHRDSACGFIAVIVGDVMAEWWIPACRLRKTAERVLDLRSLIGMAGE